MGVTNPGPSIVPVLHELLVNYEWTIRMTSILCVGLNAEIIEVVFDITFQWESGQMSLLVFQVNGAPFHGCEIRASTKEKQAGLGVFAMEDNTQGLVFPLLFFTCSSTLDAEHDDYLLIDRCTYTFIEFC